MEKLFLWGGSKKNLHVYPQDAKDFLKIFIGAGTAAGLYQLSNKLSTRSINPCLELVDRPECFNMDPVIRDTFIRLQSYRLVDEYTFSQAIKNIDQLLFLAHGLKKGEFTPRVEDRALGFTYLKVAANKLKQFKTLVLEEFGREQAKLVASLSQTIFQRAEKHYLTILDLVSSPRHPDDLMREARDILEKQYGGTSADVEEKWRHYSSNPE